MSRGGETGRPAGREEERRWRRVGGGPCDAAEGHGDKKGERGGRCAKVLPWSGTPHPRVVSHSNAWFATRAAPTPSARKAIPVSPIPASTTATRNEPRRRAISRRGGTVSTKMTRNPSASRKTTTPYRPAAARS